MESCRLWAVGGSQGEGVKGQKSAEAGVGIRKTFARECGENTNQRQEISVLRSKLARCGYEKESRWKVKCHG